MSEHQITMVSLDQLVSEKHQYRKFKSLFNFKSIESDLLAVETDNNHKGFGVLRLFKCLLPTSAFFLLNFSAFRMTL